MADQFFLSRNGKITGPVSSKAVKKGIGNGKLLATDCISTAAAGPWMPIGDIPQLKESIPVLKNPPIRVQVQPTQDAHTNIVEEAGTGNTGLWIALLAASAALNLILLGLIFLKPSPKPLVPVSEYADYMADKARLRQLGVSLAVKEELVEVREVAARAAESEPKLPNGFMSRTPDGGADSLGTSTPSSTIPADVTYTVIDETKVPGIKRGVEIRLNKHVSEDTLTAIAKEVKASDNSTYERTLIAYYLPDMQVGAGCWATTFYDPDLDVRILGLSADAAAKLSATPETADRDEIGRWLNETPFLGRRIVIFRDKDKLFMESTYEDGSSGTSEIVESQSPLGRRFNNPGGSTYGDHYVLDSNGDLQLRDDDGLISTAKKLQFTIGAMPDAAQSERKQQTDAGSGDVRITPAPNRPPVPMPTAESGNVHGAWAYTQLFVEKRLKSPSTAKFRFGGSRDVTDLGGGLYSVDSYVDSQNSFGATIRTHFSGKIRESGSTWIMESLDFDQ